MTHASVSTLVEKTLNQARLRDKTPTDRGPLKKAGLRPCAEVNNVG
jgi:hypothetical protein